MDFHIFSNLSEDLIHKYYDLIQKDDYIEDDEFEYNQYPDLQETDFNFEDFNPNNKEQLEAFSRIMSHDELKLNAVLDSSTFTEKVKNKVLSDYVSRKKWNSKLYPSKDLTRFNTLKSHYMEWSRSTPSAVPDKYGLKILIFSKFSSSKWFEDVLKQQPQSENYKFKYSIAVSVKTETNINLRNRIRQILRQRAQIVIRSE